jgi:hypothetical protein
MIDTTETLHKYLSTVAGITAQVGARLYGPPGLPAGYNGQKALVLLPDGGESRTTVPLEPNDFQIRCYGPTAADGQAVYRALHAALNGTGPVKVAVTGGNVILGRAWKTMGPRYMVEPELGWPLWVTGWHIIFTDRTVP